MLHLQYIDHLDKQIGVCQQGCLDSEVLKLFFLHVLIMSDVRKQGGDRFSHEGEIS